MMVPTSGMLEALEKYYGQKYHKVIASAILTAFGVACEREYMLDVYQGVIAEHSVNYKTLPDLAIIEKVRRKLNPEATYHPGGGEVRALPEPVSPEIVDAIREAIDRIGRNGIGDPEGLEAMRVKAMRKRCTLYELWWLHCMENYRGVYRAMPLDFADQHEGVMRW